MKVDWNLTEPSYCKMIFQIFSPHFAIKSTTFVLLLTAGLCLIVPQFLYGPPNYDHMFALPSVPYVLLKPRLVRESPLYLYQCFTTMFFHSHYIHYARALMVVFLKMAPLEYVWKCSPFLALIGGFVINCYVALLSDFEFRGFTGVVGNSIGMYAGFLILNWKYLNQHYSHMIFPWLMNWGLVLSMFVSNMDSWKQLGFHMLCIVLGVYMGIGFSPPYNKGTRSRWLSKGFRLFSLMIMLVPLVLLSWR